MAKKDVLIRGLDESIYRRAKAAAASKGISVGNAVDEALASWAKGMENAELEDEVKKNQEFVKFNWNKIKKFKGKIAVVSEERLQGVFSTFEEARSFAKRKNKIALVFPIERPPIQREIELGPEMEI
jgi:hypothetical protein